MVPIGILFLGGIVLWHIFNLEKLLLLDWMEDKPEF